MDLPVSSHQIALLRSMTWACHVVDLGRVHEVVATTTEHVRSHWSFKMETWNLKRGGFDATLRQAAACTPRDMPIIPTYPWIEGWKLVPISWKNELKKSDRPARLVGSRGKWFPSFSIIPTSRREVLNNMLQTFIVFILSYTVYLHVYWWLNHVKPVPMRQLSNEFLMVYSHVVSHDAPIVPPCLLLTIQTPSSHHLDLV